MTQRRTLSSDLHVSPSVVGFCLGLVGIVGFFLALDLLVYGLSSALGVAGVDGG